MTLQLLAVLVMALMGMPLFACLAALGLLGLWHEASPGSGGITDVYGDLTGEKAVSLSTIPLFTLAGYLMAASKTARRLVRVGSAVLGWIPGGLAALTLFVCAFFTTFTGASGVTSLSLPATCGRLLPTVATTLPSGATSRAALAGTVIGPPSPITGSPDEVTI